MDNDVIGYRVRFDDHTNQNTKLIYATDGMLLREAMIDPLLKRYSIILLDEAHERSVQTDILFGVVKLAIKERQKQGQAASQLPPLHVVVMSATLDVDTFERFFMDIHDNNSIQNDDSALLPAPLPSSPVKKITIPGRQYPVQIIYTKEPQPDYIDSALLTALQIHDSDNVEENNDDAAKKNGDILIFLPGQEEIEDLATLLKMHLEENEAEDEDDEEDDDNNQKKSSTKTTSKSKIGTNGNKKKSKFNGDVVQTFRRDGTIDSGNITLYDGVLICTLYAALPSELQMLAFQPKPPGCTRKIILATNIAETSITLDGIRYVIDCGKQKVRDYNSATGMESLIIQNISKAQAVQRSGRAGRVSEGGVCFRLYTEHAYEKTLDDRPIPEILRVNLAQIVLQLKSMGIHDPSKFDLLTSPSKGSFKSASYLLYALDAVDEKLKLTDYGRKLSKLPLDPMYGHLLLQSVKYQCTKEMLIAVAMLSSAAADNHVVFYRPNSNTLGGESETEGRLSSSSKAAAAHKRFMSHEGDLPTYLNLYNAWRKEAVYISPGDKDPRRQSKKMATAQQQKRRGQGGQLPHSDWCKRNFINGRALARAHDVLQQLIMICSRPLQKNGLGMDVTVSCCGDDDEEAEFDIESFLKCACAGAFLNSASRISSNDPQVTTDGGLARGKYRTKVGNQQLVSIHPTSTLFNRQPAPKCVIYTELVTTKKTYIRGVTQIREEWLIEVAPKFFK